MRRLAPGLLAFILLAAVPALAQEEPPARVGRVSFVSGQLAFHLAGETQWSASAVNYPVATGGSFWVDPQSRAEIRVGVQTIGLAPNTEVDVVKLDDQVMQLGVPQGRIGLRVRQLPQGNTVEIDLPHGGVWLLQPGFYDIDAGAADQPARLMVFEGSARFVGGTLDIGIKAGEAAVISGTDPLTATTERAASDAFVEWCRSRDHREDHLAAPKYVSKHMTGYEELDQYGSWTAAPEYGQVWYPSSVPANWAPYREGHWVSVAPWGWTWVDAEPWGFAPFHYGRWARIHDRWGWIPGRLVERPVYAPALVAFIGTPGVGIAIAGARGPSVGWFPLGPNEVYWPSYTHNRDYIRNVNVTNVNVTKITNITNITVNERTNGPPPRIINQTYANRAAATVVPVRAFASAARVAPVALRVSPQTLQHAPISARPLQVKPVAAVPPAPAHRAGTPAVAAPAIHPPGTATKREPGKPGAIQPPGAATKSEPGKPPAIQPPGAATKSEPGKPGAIQPPGAATKSEPGKPPAIQPPGAATKSEPGKAHAVEPPSAAIRSEPGKAHAVEPPGAATKSEPRKPSTAVHAPPPQPVHVAPPRREAPPAAAHAPPPQPVHVAPPRREAPPAAAHAPPPQPAHAAPPRREAPPAAAHAPPPQPAHAAPPRREAPPAAVHAPPPQPAHAAPPRREAPPAAAHAPPPPPAHAAPPRPRPAAPPAAVHAAPPKKEDKKDENK